MNDVIIQAIEIDEDEPPPLESIDIIQFPQEVVFAVFSFLAPRDLGSVASTCHLWNNISADDKLWYDLYKVTKQKHLLESLPFTASAHMSSGRADNGKQWKQRFKETFHIRPGTFCDRVELNLDKSVCEEGGDLSGEIVVTVASEKLGCHGIFVRISGKEETFAVVGRSVSKRRKELGEWNTPVYGTSSWESRQKTSFTLRRGLYHVPFSFPVSTKGKNGEAIPSRSANGKGYSARIEYFASAVLVVDQPSGFVQSVPTALQMLPSRAKSISSLQEPIRKKILKDFLFGGSASFEVTLNKQSFSRGEQINVLVDVNNKSAYNVKAANISLHEWVMYRSDLRESRQGTMQTYPLNIQKSSQQVSLPFTLREWDEDVQTQPGEAPVKKGYYIQVTLDIPYAFNPGLLIPITLLQPYPH